MGANASLSLQLQSNRVFHLWIPTKSQACQLLTSIGLGVCISVVNTYHTVLLIVR